jgi:3-oxoacyl-(acyl-carrier-protein) synthase
MINDREAVRQAVAFGAAEGGNIIADLSAVLVMAGELAEWWNARFLARLAGGSPLVAQAQELGAVVADVRDAPEAPAVKNEAELRAWVEGQGWSREAVVEAIRSAGYDSASEYLAVGGHTASGLASILAERLA